MAATVAETAVRFSARDQSEVSSVAPAWFDFSSADPTIASVDADGVVLGVGPGQTTINAAVAGVSAAEGVVVNVAVPVRPIDLPATPTDPAADVIALYSDAYSAVAVDTFRADWSACGEVKDIAVEGDAIKSFAAVQYVGVEFITAPLDVTSYSRLHLDLWTPDSSVFKIKLVDFGVDGVFGNDDSEHVHPVVDAIACAKPVDLVRPAIVVVHRPDASRHARAAHPVGIVERPVRRQHLLCALRRRAARAGR